MTQRNNRSKVEVGEIIKSILVAEKKASTIGMPIVELENEYRAQDGTRIPYRALGYACLMDFLESLQRKGEILIKKRGSIHVVYLCVDEKIAHVSALVSKQKDSSRRCSRGGKRNTSRYYPRVLYQPPRLDSKTLEDVLNLIKRAQNGIHASRIIEYLHDRNNFIVDENHLIRQLSDGYHEVSVNNGMIYPIIRKKITPQNSPPKINSTNGYANGNVSAPAYRPAGSSDDEDEDNNENFEFVIKSEDVKPLPSNNSNYFHQQSQEVQLNFDDTTNAEIRENDNYRVNDDDDNDIGITVNSRTRFRLEKLIQNHPDGIWCAELPKLYQQEYSIPLNYEDMGFFNVSDFAAHLPYIFHCVRLQENGDFILYNAKIPIPDNSRRNPRPEQLSLAALHNIYEAYHEEVDPVPVLLSPTTLQRLVPEGVMTIGETVAQIFVTQLFNDITPHIDVVVVDTVTPTFFWIQLLKKVQKFDRFMRELHAFYSEHAYKYVMPIVVLEKGLNCACIFDKKWHRGVIKTVKPNSNVTVFFYDYGTVATYPPQDIHFLHRSFSTVPAQAIPCGLYNIKPISTQKWPHSVCQVFAEKVMDVPMVAMLGSIDADNNSMLIALTDTLGAVDFHISDWMINSGFAVYGKMVCIRPPNYPFRHYLECKHGKINHKVKETSNSNEIVSYDENTTALQALLPESNQTTVNSSLYKTILKLHQKSAKNDLEMSNKSNERDSRVPEKESRICNDEKLQPVVKINKIMLTQDNNATNKTIVQQNVQQISRSLNKNYGTKLLSKLCISQANKMAAMNLSSSESELNESKSTNGETSSSTASVNLPDCKNINLQKNCVIKNQENPEISLVSKKFHKLSKFVGSNGFKPIISSAKSNEISNDKQNPTKTLLAVPLHLKPEITARKNCSSEFGEIYSAFGGHGLMEPIDWNKLRNESKFGVNANDALQLNSYSPIASTPLDKHTKLSNASAFDNLQKSIRPSSLSNIQFNNDSEAPIELNMKIGETTIDSEIFASTKFDGKTEKQEIKTVRKNCYQKMDNYEEKSLASCHKDLLKKYSIKRYSELSISEEKALNSCAWNVPETDKHSIRVYPEIANSQELKKKAAKILIESHQDIDNLEGKSLASRQRDKPKSQTQYFAKTSQEIFNSEKKSSALRHRETSKSQTEYLRKNNEEISNSDVKSLGMPHEETNKETKNSKETSSKSDAKIVPKISTSVALKSPSKNCTSNIPPKRAAFLNLVREKMENKKVLPEFDDFETGDNDRLESIAWNDFLKIDSPKKNQSFEQRALKIDKKMPIKMREPVGKAFFNIINSVLPLPNQRNSLCIPEGNIMRKTELSPNSRIILKSINEDVENKQLQLFIPDDVVELFENDDSTSISSSSTDFETHKSTVKYRNLSTPIAFIKNHDSSYTISYSTASEFSSAANDSQRDFNSTNDDSSTMTGNGRQSAEKLLKSTDTSATASQTSPATAFGDVKRVTRYVNVSESNANEEIATSSKAEQIGRDNVRKLVDFGADSGLIEHLKNRKTSPKHWSSKSVDFCEDKRDTLSELTESEEKITMKSIETIGRENVEKLVDFGEESCLIQHVKSIETLPKHWLSKSADFCEDKRDILSELTEREEKITKESIEKIGRDNVENLIDFGEESCLIQHAKSIETSPKHWLSKSADFCEEKRDILSELTESEENITKESIETIYSENVKNRMDSVVELNSSCQFLSFVDDRKLTKERQIIKTSVSLTDSVSSEKFSAPEEEKTPNTLIQSSSLKPNDFLFANFRKFFGSCNDSADNSDLDSDDLSFAEDSNENLSTKLNKITEDNDSSKLQSFANKINESVDETSRRSLDSNDNNSSYSDFTIEIHSKETDYQIDNKSVNCEDLEKAEKSICLPTITKESSVQLAKKDEQFVPCYDDTCVISDDEKWDFDSNFDNNHVDDFNTDQRKNSFTDDVITNIEDDSIDGNKNDDSISINESLEINSNVAYENSTVCNQTSHSILSEVQKLNISATANAFAHINSIGSSSSISSLNDESYTKSFMNALKHYL